MVNINNNVVENVLECLRSIEMYKNKLKLCTLAPPSIKEYYLDAFEELTIVLCRLITQLVTAPISGRMFIPLPASQCTHSDKQTSLTQQLQAYSK